MQTPTPFSSTLVNINAASVGEKILPVMSAVMATGQPLLSFAMDPTSIASVSIRFDDHERFHASLVDYKASDAASTFQHPHCVYYYPVYERPRDKTSKIVAFFLCLLPFDRYLVNLLPKGVNGIDAVLRNRDQVFTYRLNGNSVSWRCVGREGQDSSKGNISTFGVKALYVGPHDLHDPRYDHTKRRIPFYTYTDESINNVPEHWAYSL
jgi:hypothetical protein